jgi:3-hydroxyacyl-CoA dehydrogenase
MVEIKKAAVIGSGVMGAQIAAHLANAGCEVLLFDIVPADATEPNQLAAGAIERMKKMDPAPFMHRDFVKRVTAANLRDDLGKLKDIDWIIEAIIENPAIKSDLYKKLDGARKKGSIVSSNTSTLPLSVLTQGQSEQFQKDFLITHFFNPPRYMRLLELVGGPKTDPAHLKFLREVGDVQLGKSVVMAKDTPGFIANRIGIFWLECAVLAAMDLGLTVEETDAVMGKPLNIPKTGVFGLIDLVGLDLMPLIAKSFLATLPANDAYRAMHRDVPVVNEMIANGYTGRKGKGGFYRINRDGGGKVKESIDLKTGGYAPSKEARLAVIEAAGKDLKRLCEDKSKIGQFTWRVLRDLLTYVASLMPQIADDIVAVDEAMRNGFNWGDGPFQMLDRLGVDWFNARLKADGFNLPPFLEKAAGKSFYTVKDGKLNYLTLSGEFAPVQRAQGVLLLEDVKRAGKPVYKTGSASLWDIGDGVLCLEFHTKMNAIDPDVFKTIQEGIKIIRASNGKYKAMVVHNEASNFSVGANLGLALFAINIASWETIEMLVREGQKTYAAMRRAPFPVVGSIHGMALGGGCEAHLHCDAVVAHAETYTGLVEVGVGVMPGWGGCVQMLGRAYNHPKQRKGPMPAIAQMFETIAMAKISKSAFEAREMLFLVDGKHKIAMNSDRCLYEAKQMALQMAPTYKPAEQYTYRLPGKAGKAALMLAIQGLKLMGKVTPHDEVVSAQVAEVLSGGNTNFIKTLTEDEMYELEFQGFMKLIHNWDSIARIEHMLETGKPLRN